MDYSIYKDAFFAYAKGSDIINAIIRQEGISEKKGYEMLYEKYLNAHKICGFRIFPESFLERVEEYIKQLINAYLFFHDDEDYEEVPIDFFGNNFDAYCLNIAEGKKDYNYMKSEICKELVKQNEKLVKMKKHFSENPDKALSYLKEKLIEVIDSPNNDLFDYYFGEMDKAFQSKIGMTARKAQTYKDYSSITSKSTLSSNDFELTIKDVIQLPDYSIKNALGNIASDDIVYCIKTVCPELENKIIPLMSKRAGQMLKEDLMFCDTEFNLKEIKFRIINNIISAFKYSFLRDFEKGTVKNPFADKKLTAKDLEKKISSIKQERRDYFLKAINEMRLGDFYINKSFKQLFPEYYDNYYLSLLISNLPEYERASLKIYQLQNEIELNKIEIDLFNSFFVDNN